MNELTNAAVTPMPVNRPGLVIRPGVMEDVPFMDSLQKLHTKQVGWMPRAQFEGKIRLGHVLVAEEIVGATYMSPGTAESAPTGDMYVAPTRTPVGYCIGNDQYFKRDDLGIIYQMNVLPGRQRGLIGASLLKAQFERSAYGCRLYCCWCAQDIAANRFWEAMGFVPLAFRTGGETKGPNGTARMHIFWQKRIRTGDTGDISRGGTAWWFPSQTSGGSIRSGRIVLPIPPGTHWSDAKPILLPGMPMPGDTPALPAPRTKRKTKAEKTPPVAVRPTEVSRGGFWFPPVSPSTPVVETLPATIANETTAMTETKKPKAPKPTNDPRLVAAARELRDRWLETVNASPLIGREKYAVGVTNDGPIAIDAAPMKLLSAA